MYRMQADHFGQYCKSSEESKMFRALRRLLVKKFGGVKRFLFFVTCVAIILYCLHSIFAGGSRQIWDVQGNTLNMSVDNGCGVECPPDHFSFYVRTGEKNTVKPTICFQGKVVLSPDVNAKSSGRGLNIALIDGKQFQVKEVKQFDTYVHDNDLIRYLKKGIPDDWIVIIATFDEAASGLRTDARKWLKLYGSSLIDGMAFRDSFVMVGQRGLLEGHAIEYINKRDKSEDYAAVLEKAGCFAMPLGPLGSLQVALPEMLQGKAIALGEALPHCGRSSQCPKGTVSVGTFTGFENAKPPYICVNGRIIMSENLNKGGRGFNVVTLSSQSLQPVTLMHADTYTSDSTDLELYLEALVNGDIVIAVVADDGAKKSLVLSMIVHMGRNAILNEKANNQKLGLCEALLEIGAWDNAKVILDGLPDAFAISHKPIVQALCRLIHAAIDPMYSKYTGLSSALTKRRPVPVKRPGVEVLTTFADLSRVAFPMVLYLGPHIATDPPLLVKLIRIGRAFMNKRHDGHLSSSDEAAYYGLLSVVDDSLLPSLSLQPGNCCMAEELWGLVRHYPYEIRYRMYGHWKNETYYTHPKLIRVRADTVERAKYIMRRISKETVKPSGRQLGKLGHSNPGVLFELILTQIQRYENFISPIVDSLKYLTPMSYDILAYCIIEAVANPEKERMKTDDTNISMWLQSLANFAGAICRKYTIELTGIMQYVANQLKAGKSLDLLLLREVVQKMAGIEVSEEITDDQLNALSGGELLRQEGGNFQQVRNMKKSSTRLKDTLLERDLGLSLCLLMSQQRSSVVFREDDNRHLKLVGKLYDQCQDTLVQFGSFLSNQLSTEEFVKRLPPIDTLIATYHVPQDAAFFLSRTQYTHSIHTRYEELRKADKKSSNSVSLKQRYIESTEETQKPVLETLRPLFPARIWEDFTPLFYWTFWSMSMYDLRVPSQAYEKQIQLLHTQIQQTDDSKDMPQSKKKKERERCQQLIEKLKDEEKKQTEHVAQVMARLKKERESWFPSGTTKSEMTTNFLQMCLFPRCRFTASDALYCGYFIQVLHTLKTPNFSTLICYDRIFCDITYTLTSCTENEGHRYGRFLASALDTIMRWHGSFNIYDKECANYPGFVTVFRKGSDSNNKMDRLDFENFRHVCHKWHFRITKAIIACLESGSFIQIRNALIILTKILPHFPRIVQIGMAIERRVDKLSKEEKDKRPDLYALAIGYSGQLKMKKATWVPEADFHIKEPKAQAKGAAAAGSTKDGPQAANSRKTDDGKTKDGRGGESKAETRDDRNKDKSERRDKGEKREKRESKKASVNNMDASDHSDSPKHQKDRAGEDKKGKEPAAAARGAEPEEGGRHKEAKGDKLGKEEKAKKGDKKDKERGKERDKGKRGHGNHEDEETGPSTSSSHRRSLEPPPLDDRETKRRKLEMAGTSSQDSPSDNTSRSKNKSPTAEREFGDRERDSREQRKEKKREHSMDGGDADMKKRRGGEEYYDHHHDHHTQKSKLNGEQNGSGSRSREERSDRSHSKERTKHDGAAKLKESRKDATPTSDESPRSSKSKEKKSSSKKQKK